MAKKKQTNVLLIEDSTSDARLVQDLLCNVKHEHFNVVTASTLSEGLDRLSRDLVDVIILDLSLPDSQGLETLRAVHEHAPPQPIIVLTGSDDEELGSKAVQEGAQRVLTKDALTDSESYAGIFTRMIRYAIEQKRAEAVLKASEEQFRTLFDDSPVAQVRYDAIGRPVEANKAAHTFLGIKGIADLEHLTIFTSPRVSDHDKAQLRAGHPVRYELSYDFAALRESKYFPTTHSSVRYADIHTTPLFTAEGSVGGYLAQIVDITDSKHAAKERDSIARFPEENPDPVLRIGSTGQILYANAAAEALLQAVDHRKGDAVPTQWMTSLDEAYKRGKLLTEDITAASRVFLMRFVPVPDEGYVDVYGTDITRRKEVENALHQSREEVQSLNEELTSANQELSIVNEALEQRVHERTRKLASLNEELTSANENLMVANEELINEIRHRVSAELEARANASHIKLLNDVITAGNQADTLQTAMQAMLDAAVDLLGFDGGLLYLHTDPDNVAELRAWRRAPEELVKQGCSVPITIPNLAPVYRGESWFTDAYPDVGSPEYRGVMKGVRATAVVPLTAGDHIVGHYGVWSAWQHNFSPQEQALLEAIGREAGTVIGRMQAEEQLRTSSRYARSLIEASLDPLVTISAEGKITDVNEATEGATGFSRDELIGSDFSDYFTEPAAAKAGYQRVFTYGYVRDYPLAIRHQSGSIRDAMYNATVFRNDSGEIQGVFAAARDITKQKQAQDALMEAHEEVRSLNEALESTNKELRRYSQQLEELIAERTSQLRDAERLAGIGETAAMIGHDLRNPLQGLQYIVDLQKLRFERIPPEKRGVEDWKNEEGLFDHISEQVFYMDKIVADLQDYARPIAPEPEVVAVSTLINDVLASLPHTDHVEIRSDVSDLTVIADPHLMHRVFANLVLNAIQAMPDGGKLSVSATTDDGPVTISVSDTGVGIPDDMRDKLFSPLITGKAKGTGLGLAVVKRIVDAHGGTMTFESREGKGTTFSVTLPSVR